MFTSPLTVFKSALITVTSEATVSNLDAVWDVVVFKPLIASALAVTFLLVVSNPVLTWVNCSACDLTSPSILVTVVSRVCNACALALVDNSPCTAVISACKAVTLLAVTSLALIAILALSNANAEFSKATPVSFSTIATLPSNAVNLVALAVVSVVNTVILSWMLASDPLVDAL